MGDARIDDAAKPGASLLRRVVLYVSGDPEHTTVDRRVYRTVCACAVVLCLAFLFPINLALDPTGLTNIPVAALGISMAVLSWMARRGRCFPGLVVASTAVVMDASWFLSAGSSGSVPAFIPASVVFLAVYPARAERARGACWLALNYAALFVADYLFPGLRIPYRSETDRFFDVTLGALVSAAACLAILSVVLDSYRWEQRRLEAANRELARSLDEIQTLRGLLPVCSWCGKVRDDSGLWTQVAQYLAGHTRLTHSICPECQGRYFVGEVGADDEGSGLTQKGRN